MSYLKVLMIGYKSGTRVALLRRLIHFPDSPRWGLDHEYKPTRAKAGCFFPLR